ncbi:hypothetical protein E1B28_000639 [Marasmius oreades]|uniref:Zn(2)-C6 fungal-type domain-containing protein n=1 Tax=Marasmius oreades TaxID=181124 RepID=A0A9P8AEC5_9AGAR|nr:uncharacterized protein E1B28_000639 [Marasmius oreades]KAG7098726.1 hypothetical protein E1B28_000639 [Marasmius oreades]
MSANAASFHTFPQLTPQEKTDIRRVKGQISCAECRRLKLKCDKKTPCSSCLRRGCGSVCPTGTLTNTPGKRMVVSDTTALHKKIEEMGQRIRQLEDALAILQSSISAERHPLLREEYLKIKFPPALSDTNLVKEEKEGSNSQDVELSDALGTLTLGEYGDTRYLGRSAGSESLLGVAAELHTTESRPTSYTFVSEEVAQLSYSFPFGGGTWNVPHSLRLILSFLPPKLRAWSLCETYLAQGTITTKVVLRDELIDEILTPVYRYVESFASNEDQDEEAIPVSPHRLAILYLVFALGSLWDLTIPPYSVEAENFFELGRACLSLRNVFGSLEIGTVQALALASLYHSHGGPRLSPETAWCLMGLCARLLYRLGLHSESPQWHLEPKLVQRRRTLFWEIFTLDTFFSLNLGRPPSMNISFVDCPLPDEDPTMDEERERCMRWGWKFAKDVVVSVSAATLTPKIPEYDVILELDKKLRQQGMPPDYNYATDTCFQPRGLLMSAFTWLHIHRSFFVKAILDFPHNPMSSPYAPSFLAAYRAATMIIQLDVKWFSKHPALMSRSFMIFNSLFTAGVVVGSIVTRCPNSPLASRAFIELGLTVEMFSMMHECSSRARAAHTILKKFHDKAGRTFSLTKGQGQTQAVEDLGDFGIPLDDELEIFAGYTKLRMSKTLSGRTPDGMSCSPNKDGAGSKSESLGESGSKVRGVSSSPQDEILATYGGDPFTLSMFSTAGHVQQCEPVEAPAMGVYPESDTNMGGWSPMFPTSTAEMSMAGDSGMEAQWLMFMQSEGILDGNGYLNTSTS